MRRLFGIVFSFFHSQKTSLGNTYVTTFFVLGVIGDGICDDSYNIRGCSYDGGDCCTPNSNFASCSQCECIVDTPTNTLIANGFCNDITNNAECSYDGGDCCGSCIVKEYCSECVCISGEYSKNYQNVHLNLMCG